jgi:hypothetical protein
MNNATFSLLTHIPQAAHWQSDGHGENKQTYIGKRFLLENNELIKTFSGSIHNCYVDRVSISLAELQPLLETCTHNHALMCSLPVSTSDKRLYIKSASKAGTEDAHRAYISRTKEYFKFSEQPSLMLIDVDRQGCIDTALSALYQACPALKKTDHLITSSTSSNIYLGDKELNGQTGLHIYVGIEQGTQIHRALHAIHNKLITLRHVFAYVNDSGDVFTRTYVDTQMAVETQPCFIKAACDNGLTQNKFYQFVKGEKPYLSVTDIPTLTDSDMRLVNSTKMALIEHAEPTALKRRQSCLQALLSQGVPFKDAVRITHQQGGAVLEPSTIIDIQRLGRVTAQELADNLDKFPDGSRVADIRSNPSIAKTDFSCRLSHTGYKGPHIFNFRTQTTWVLPKPSVKAKEAQA